MTFASLASTMLHSLLWRAVGCEVRGPPQVRRYGTDVEAQLTEVCNHPVRITRAHGINVNVAHCSRHEGSEGPGHESAPPGRQVATRRSGMRGARLGRCAGKRFA